MGSTGDVGRGQVKAVTADVLLQRLSVEEKREQ